jgi:hypothetical protein
MDKFDPNRYEQRFVNWRIKGSPMPGISQENRQLILEYVADMEIGMNVNPASRKGARAYSSLQGTRTKMLALALWLERELKINSLTELESKELELMKFFNRMRAGEFKRKDESEPIKATGMYVKNFKAFWHWYQRVQRKKSIDVKDITIDLDRSDIKHKFNYFTIEGLRKMCNEANYFYRVLMTFLFDSGIRAPTELMNVKVSDLEWNEEGKYYHLNIREETSKTFGRKIKLLLCSEILKEYLQRKNLDPDEPIFKKDPKQVNQYLKNLGYSVLQIGEGVKTTYNFREYVTVRNGLSMYDFRHCSACYWMPRYKSESAMKYRFGWKKKRDDWLLYGIYGNERYYLQR